MAPYEPGHAELYDAVFRSRGKDFDTEAAAVVALARARSVAVRSLLDVACGTGAHLETYAKNVAHVEGIDYSQAMLDVARRKLPDVPLCQADMRDFDLGRVFDVVVSLGNSVACVGSPAELDAAVARLAEHTAPGGTLVVEPWFFPSNYVDGHVGGHVMIEDGRVVSRVTRSTRDGEHTRHEVCFTVADRDGIHTFTEDLVVLLLPQERWEEAFRKAGCSVELLPAFDISGRLNSPGLFVARPDHCGIGSWGARCLRMAHYVRRRRPRAGHPPPEPG